MKNNVIIIQKYSEKDYHLPSLPLLRKKVAQIARGRAKLREQQAQAGAIAFEIDRHTGEERPVYPDVKKE